MIATHYAPHCETPWLAVDMAAASEMLEGYGLTDKEKTNLPELMAGYCRLLDDAGMCHYGDTEEEAIANCRNKTP